ncbi:MAG TPA: hypothetical protein VK783_16465 [Bacteroidia bacterium]|jgi:putative GTP pyrophosphokinase|nr:hypothetical protein [Bacteroidia bacterium]
MLDIKQITERWEKDEPLYQELGKNVSKFIRTEIPEYEIMPETSFRTKELLSIIKKIKNKLKEKDYSYDHLNDKLGIRIICAFKDDMSKVDSFINTSFTVKKVEYKEETLNFDRLDYISNHYDLQINPTTPFFKPLTHLKDFIFEVQVRTLNQHAWSNAAHALTYKQEADIAPNLKRRVYRLLSLYEIADDEFSAVNSAMMNNPDNILYTMLRKLEGKTYKYAKMDFDRKTSLSSLKSILGFFPKQEQKNILESIDNFITQNSKKIGEIYDLNRTRFAEISFLSQPEIFLVWYGLEKYSFTIEDNWSNDFDSEDLEQIKTLWGKSID